MTPPPISLKAPAAVIPGALVQLQDGSTTTVDASGNISCPVRFHGVMLNAGWTVNP